MKLKIIKMFLFSGIFLLFAVTAIAGERVADKTKLNVISSDKNLKTQTEVIEQTQDISEKAPIISEPIASPTRAGEQINWQVISGGGTEGSSTSYNLTATVGQTATGDGVSESYKLAHGYWQSPGTGICDCEPGEVDGAPLINILDIVYIINFKYKSGPDPVLYVVCSADTDCDCQVNILDIVYLINFKYKEGPVPCTCEAWVSRCGPLH